MWDIVEEGNPGLQRHDPHSWVKQCGLVGKYGLSSRGPCFHPQLVMNRQNPSLARAIGSVLDVGLEDLLVSHDRFTIYRATALDAEEYVSGVSADSNSSDNSSASSNGSSNTHPGRALRTGRRNVHLDLNPWWWTPSRSSGGDTQGSRDVRVKTLSLSLSLFGLSLCARVFMNVNVRLPCLHAYTLVLTLPSPYKHYISGYVRSE